MKEGMVGGADGGRGRVGELSEWAGSCENSDTVVSRVEIDRPDQGTSCMINSIMKSGADNNMIGEQVSGCMPVSVGIDETYGCASDSSIVFSGYQNARDRYWGDY